MLTLQASNTNEAAFSPGSEVAGIVRAVGAGVTHLKPGDRVMAQLGHGAFGGSRRQAGVGVVKLSDADAGAGAGAGAGGNSMSLSCCQLLDDVRHVMQRATGPGQRGQGRNTAGARRVAAWGSRPLKLGRRWEPMSWPRRRPIQKSPRAVRMAPTLPSTTGTCWDLRASGRLRAH